MASTSQINSYYQQVFGRPASPDEANYWSSVQANAALDDSQIILSLATSAEAAGAPATVLRVYEAVFGHKPDQAGFAYWEQQLAAGITVTDLADKFVTSAEFKTYYGVDAGFDIASFVTKLYTNVLGRAPDANGLAAWVNSGLTPAQLIVSFAQSAEYISRAAPEVLQFLMQAAAGTEDYQGSIFTDLPLPAGKSDGLADIATAVQNLFTGLLQRAPTQAELDLYKAELGSGAFSLSQIAAAIATSAEANGNPSTIIRVFEATFGHKPDKAGFDFWVDQLAAGASVDSIIDSFTTSLEFKDHYGVGDSFELTSFVKALFQNVLGRQPDVAGLDFWLTSGLTPAQILQQFTQSPEFVLRADPKIVTFFQNIASGVETYQGSIFDSKLPGAAGQNDPTGVGGGGGDPGDVTAPTVTITSAAGLTNSLKQTVSGTVGTEDAGTTVHIFDNGTDIGTAIVGADGKWTADITLTDSQGTHQIVAKDTDVSGNTGASIPVSYTLDSVAPNAPSVTLTNDTGTSNSDNITKDANLTVTPAEGGGTVDYVVDGKSVAIYDPASLKSGTHTVDVTQTDAAGNVSAKGTVTFTLDTDAPDAPLVTLKTDTGSSNSDKITNQGDLQVTSEIDATVEYSSDGLTWTSSFTAQEGSNSVHVRQTDTAGNVSGTTTFDFTLDTTVPGVTAALTSDTGSSTVDGVTSSAKIEGIGEANASVVITEAGSVIGTATADAGGVWSFTPGALADGAHTFVATETDAAGNIGSATLSFTLDKTAPVVTANLVGDTGSSSSDGLTSNPALKGTGDANALVTVLEGATVLGTTTADASGNWTFTPSSVSQGPHTLKVSETDLAGNTGTKSISFTYDSLAPTVSISTNGAVTNDTTHSISGKGEANTTIELFDNGTSIGTVVANGSGNWSKNITLSGDGDHIIKATDTDAAGNSASSSITFSLDTKAPLVTLGLSADTGSSNSDKITSSPNIQGSGDANATVSIFDGSKYLGSTTADGSGNWTFAPSGLTDGSHTLKATETDAAGNSGSAYLTFTLDKTAPGVSISLDNDTGSSTSDKKTSDASLTGSADAYATVTIKEGATVLGTTTANKYGDWSFTPSSLSQGSHTVTVSETDTAGNVGSKDLTFTYDTVAPTLTNITGSYSSSQGGRVTAGASSDEAISKWYYWADNSSQANSIPSSKTTVYDNGGTTLSDTSHDSGNYLHIAAVDIVGNVSSIYTIHI